jgi:hypothetical protein
MRLPFFVCCCWISLAEVEMQEHYQNDQYYLPATGLPLLLSDRPLQHASHKSAKQ